MVLTAFLVVVGNAAAAGPVGRPLLSGFYSTFTAIVPQGSGVSLLRSVSYFGGNGAMTPLVTLAIWAGSGALLAFLATASRVNYRALYERYLPGRAGRDRALLRPGVLSPAD
jgi:amino acid transporter